MPSVQVLLALFLSVSYVAFRLDAKRIQGWQDTLTQTIHRKLNFQAVINPAASEASLDLRGA